MLQRNGVSIHFEVSGRNHGPVLVLLHPLGANLGVWEPQRAEFERFFRVLRIDMRGHGKSQFEHSAPQPCTLADLAADALAVLDSLHIDRAHWCGVSIGGLIALQVAVTAPRRVGRLVLANTGAAFAPAAAWDERIAAVRAQGLEPLLAGVPQRWFSAAFREREPQAVAHVMELLRATQPRGYLEACSALRDADLTAQLAAVQAPTLVIAGAGDAPPALERAEQLANGIAGADLLVLDAAHLANVEQAEDFTAAVVDFLRD